MRSIVLLTLMFFTFLLCGAQHYTIHSTTSGVEVESGGGNRAAAKGMTLKATDILKIPKEGKVEIYNSLDKRIYTSLRTGSVSVTKLMIEARSVADSNVKSVSSKLRFGKKGGNTDKRVYVEKGMVNRSLALFDPESGNIEMNPDTLAKFLTYRLLIPDSTELPLPVRFERTEVGGVNFQIENNRSFPVYFNVLRLQTKEKPIVTLSPLGQPEGSYLLLPSQRLTLEHADVIPDNERHFIYMTPCRVELNDLVDRINRGLDAGEKVWDGEELPVTLINIVTPN